MADSNFQFIHSTAKDVSAQSGTLSAESKRVVRVQAMKDFRRRQRGEVRNTTPSRRPGMPQTARNANEANQRNKVATCQAGETIQRISKACHGSLSLLMPGDDSTHPASRCQHGIPPCHECQDLTIENTKPQLHGSSDLDSNVEIATLRSPPANRSQLRQELASIFHPASSQDPDFIYSQFVREEHLQPRGASMTAAIDTLCLLHIGTYHNDKALLHEASTRRDVALTHLMKDLRRQNAIQDDEMLGAMWILNFCDSFSSISKLPKSARTHVDAVAKIFTSRTSTSQTSRLGQVLMYNIRSSAINWGLFHRKPILYAESQPINPAQLASPLETELIELMLQIPTLLDLDQSEQSTTDRFPERTRLDELCHMESRLLSWLVKWISTFHHEPYYMVSAILFTHFTAFTESVAEIFPRAIQFPSFAAASLQMSYWIGLMQVKQAILELTGTLPYDKSLQLRETALLDDIDECAAHLCQSAAFTTQPKYGFCGVMRCIAPIYFAAKWYLQQRDFRKVKWCKTTITRIQESYQFTSPYGLPWADGEEETGPSNRVGDPETALEGE